MSLSATGTGLSFGFTAQITNNENKRIRGNIFCILHYVKVKVKLALEQVTKAKRGGLEV
jgi:hypothetical protein